MNVKELRELLENAPNDAVIYHKTIRGLTVVNEVHVREKEQMAWPFGALILI